MTDNIDIIKEHYPDGQVDALHNSYIFVTKENDYDNYVSGYSFDRIFREDLSKDILVG